MKSRRRVNSNVVRVTHMLLSRLRIAVVISFLPLCISCARPEPYSAVPPNLRSRLDERLKLLVQNMRAQRWDDMYDLFSDAYKNDLKAFHCATKSEYVAAENQLPKDVPPFDDFRPTSSREVATHAYRISGIITLRDANQTFDKDASLEARWQNDDWYFSEFCDESKR